MIDVAGFKLLFVFILTSVYIFTIFISTETIYKPCNNNSKYCKKELIIWLVAWLSNMSLGTLTKFVSLAACRGNKTKDMD